MKGFILDIFRKLLNNFEFQDQQIETIGRGLVNQQKMLTINCLQDAEFKVYSQCGDDGIIQYLIRELYIENRTFIEFGVEDYLESNTRFLMVNNLWSGFIYDGCSRNIEKIKSSYWYWKYEINAEKQFITKTNVNSIFERTNLKNIGILSIDIDGNDYHILDTINLSHINPSIIIIEYNANFGPDKAITIPYIEKFNRTNAHYSNLFYGASLRALDILCERKGYSLIGVNSNGVNAYFVRNDLLNDTLN